MQGEENINTKTLDLGEIRTVDPITGAEKGAKLQRFSLIPSEFLWALATHYGVGAKKYTKELPIADACATIEKLCTCNMKNTAVDVVSSKNPDSLKQANAEVVMKNNYVVKTFNMPNRSVRILDDGRHLTEQENKNKIVWLPDEKLLHVSDLQKQTRQELSQNKMVVQSVTVDQTDDGFTLTTIMQQANSEAYYVENVIKGLGIFETIQIISKLHEDTCNSTQLKWQQKTATLLSLSGDRNWEKGYKWSLSLDASMRHLNQWLMGEDHDAETGSNHLICAIWHLIALYYYQRWGKGTDDVRAQMEGV